MTPLANTLEHLTPGTPSYKKARKQYLKSTSNRPSNDSFGWTPFRTAEKKYKARFPPPDLSDVLDLALLDDERIDEVELGKWKGRVDAIKTQEIGLLKSETGKKRRAFCIPQVPGLVLLPGYLSAETQRRLARWSLADHARAPNQTNLDVHYKIPEEGLWNLHISADESQSSESKLIRPQDNDPTAVAEPPGPRQLVSNTPVNTENYFEILSQPKPPTAPSTAPSTNLTPTELLPRLRWANIGWFYHWGTKQYDFGRGKVEVGEPVRSICKEIVRSINWKDVFVIDEKRSLELCNGRLSWGETGPDWDSWNSSYEPDAGIVNFYQYKDTLMGHVDRSEVCATSPLVSMSLGNAAVFLIGGLTRDEKPVAILLRSGDAVVMAGPGCRRAYHGVPRILEGALPAHLSGTSEPDLGWLPYSQYLQTTRINVNVRQVFPKGFDPSLGHRRPE